MVSSVTTPHRSPSRHFVFQNERPERLADVDATKMDPSLRCLLYTDGTVTRALETQALAPVDVRFVRQAEASASPTTAAYLGLPNGAATVLRRVTIGLAERAAPVIWAESHIVPERLPAGFLSVLRDAADGIGQSLQQVKLESWRDMLWFGLGRAPEWAEGDRDTHAVTRLYRVVTGGQPALLIRESFAVTADTDGNYRLALGA